MLIDLGYLLPGDGDGRFGPATQNAILAFQKWERLGRTGLLDDRTKARLAVALHPAATSRGLGTRDPWVLVVIRSAFPNSTLAKYVSSAEPTLKMLNGRVALLPTATTPKARFAITWIFGPTSALSSNALRP